MHTRVSKTESQGSFFGWKNGSAIGNVSTGFHHNLRKPTQKSGLARGLDVCFPFFSLDAIIE